VVEAERNEIRPEGDAHFNFPASTIGGGYPVVCDVQGQEHLASVACLVTDGHKTYALTNRHVAGEAGSPISAIIGRNKVRIGESSKLQLGRLPFKKLYPSWPGDNVFVDLDVGLIDVDDLNTWTTQVYGVGEIGALADLSDSNISLRLIGVPVRAYGAGDNTIHDLGVIDKSALETLYQNPQFLPSKTLDQIGPILKGGSAPAPTTTKPKRRAQPRRPTRR
jgi:hypothetical protein